MKESVPQRWSEIRVVREERKCVERINDRRKEEEVWNQDGIRKDGIGKLLGVYLERVWQTGCCRDSGRKVGIDDEQLGCHSSDLGEEGAARRRQVPFSLFLSPCCCPPRRSSSSPLLPIESIHRFSPSHHSLIFTKLCLLHVRFTWITHASVISIVKRGIFRL